MILPERRQHRVAEREAGLGEVASDEVGVFAGECALAEKFLREQQAGAAVEEQARGFA